MATEARSNFNKYVVPGLFAVAKEGFKRHDETWKNFYATRTSSKAYEESSYMSGFGQLAEKKEGTKVSYDARIQGPVKRWSHKSWALGVRITHEAIEDARYGVMKSIMKDLGVSAAATRHYEAMKLIMNGYVTTYNTAGDGLALFSSSHARLDGSTWSNTTTAADPTTATVEAAVKNFENIVDHRGKRYDQKAKAVYCGPPHEFTMAQILESTNVAENANNGKNTLKTRRNLKLIVEPEITDGRWGVMGEKDEDVGLIWFDREKPSVTRHGDPETGDTIYIIYGRWSNECNDPRFIYGIPAS